MTVTPHNPSRNAVFFLEDNPDVLDASTAFFESYGVTVIRAQTPGEAWRELERWKDVVRCAYIDKTLQRQHSAGFDFVEEARKRFPAVDFAVVTGWPLTEAERSRVTSRNIALMEKARSSPADLLARFDPTIGKETPAAPTGDIVDDSAASPADILYRSRLAEETLSQREAKFQIRLGRIARDLVRRIEEDTRFGDGAIYIGASSYSSDELIQEICDGSELGLSLLDTHFAEIEELARQVHQRR
jgi:CheY-like chemotaxis protein